MYLIMFLDIFKKLVLYLNCKNVCNSKNKFYNLKQVGEIHACYSIGRSCSSYS
jgi:hypothetical protein